MKKLTKIATNGFALVESAKTIEEYGASVRDSLFKMGDDHLSPPIDYWVAGEIIGDIECGRSLRMKRSIRNGVEVAGMFQTSQIEYIEKIGDNLTYIVTKNSLYTLEDYIYERVP